MHERVSNLWRWGWEKALHHGEIFVVLCILALMLARNPYSNRTLIANLEPYPDSIHYINPARSLLNGDGLYITREGRKILPTVPPIYSLTLLPVFLFSSDVRSFYFVNVLLTFVSVSIFYAILQKVFPGKRWLIFSLIFLFVTNHLTHWYPSLAMAENALLPIILTAVYALLFPPTRKTAVIIPMLAVACYATKFASLPLAIIIPVLFSVRILRMKNRQQKIKVFAYFVLASLVWGTLYLFYDSFIRQEGGLIKGLFGIFVMVFSPKSINEAMTTDIQKGSIFSLVHAQKNINAYLWWLLGNQMDVLWKRLALLPKYLAWPALFGLVISLFTRRRLIAAIWMAFILTTISIMMTFYAADGRYMLFALPAMITGLGLFCAWVSERFPTYSKKIITFLPLLLISVYIITQATRLKFDVMLNLRYSEFPWYYTSIRVFDTYLANHRQEFAKEPVIISSLPPYLIDFYAKEKFTLLPLSPQQEFQFHQQAAWGDHNYKDLHGEFARYLAAGHPVFLTQYGLGNVKVLQSAYTDIFTRFELEKVVEDCYSTCNVYRIVKEK